MLSFVQLRMFVLLPLPWLLRAVLPARRVSEVSVRVPFGDRLLIASENVSSPAKAAKKTQGWPAPELLLEMPSDSG